MKSALITSVALICAFTCAAADYYWVGGSGQWSDLRHWVTLSGGDVQHSQVPTANDNVIFDVNSFNADGQEVEIDLDNVFCRSLDFSGVDVEIRLTGSRQRSINIHGSLNLHPAMDLEYRGSFEFRGALTGNTIDFSGRSPHTVDFVGDGEWTFNRGVAVDSLLRIQFGTVAFGDGTFRCERFEVNSSSGVNIDLGDAGITVLGDRFRGPASGFRWVDPLWFRGPGSINITPGNSRFVLPSSTAGVDIEQIQNINLGEIVLGRPNGQHRFYSSWWGDMRIKRLELLGDTEIRNGQFTIENLVLGGGQTVTLPSDQDQWIGNVSTSGSCNSWILLRSVESGRPSRINATSGGQSLEFVQLKDIHISGATYEAITSVDLGGNAGWSFDEKISEDFYWIGNTGDWGDVNNWSSTSGGTPAGCLPSAADDVIFDANSFSANGQQVRINVPGAYCRDMDWRDIDEGVRLIDRAVETETSIHVFGSLWFSTDLENSFNGPFYFESPRDGNTITTADIEFLEGVYFDSESGAWTLQDKFDVQDTLWFQAGTIRTNDQVMEFFRMFSRTYSQRTWDLGNSTIRVVNNPSPRRNQWGSNIEINAFNFNLVAGSSTIECTNGTDFYTYEQGTLEFNKILFYGGGAINTNTWWSRDHRFLANRVEFYWDGWFSGTMSLDTLLFSPGRSYTFEMRSDVVVEDLQADGDCTGSIYMTGVPRNVPGKITSGSDSIVVSNVTIQSVNAGGRANFVARNSIDEGNNAGWSFDQAPAPRVLYWVGQGATSSWFEPMNWSSTSGGPGGECVPTIIDDVFFDENSNNGAQRWADLNRSLGAVCHDITFVNGDRWIGLGNGDFKISGSLSLDAQYEFFPWGVLFSSNDTENTIQTNENSLSWANWAGTCRWTLEDDLEIHNWAELYSGTLATEGFTLTTGQFIANSYPLDQMKRLELGSSTLRLFSPYNSNYDGDLYVNTRNFDIDAGTSTLLLTQPYSEIINRKNYTLELNRVIFSSNYGYSVIEQEDTSNFAFNYLQFNNDGYIQKSNTVDSLLLAPGKIYSLENGHVQQVEDYLLARGTNCTPVGLVSDVPGVQTSIRSSRADIVADFVQMQDQMAEGTAAFFAGNNSTDISNNTGWTFGNPPEFVETGFLGPDRALCANSEIVLDAYNYNPDETYRWSTNTTDSAISVSAPGQYYVDVRFANGCELTDTVNILEPEELVPFVGNDTVLCEGEVLALDADLMLEGARYYWQDSTFGAEYTVAESGTYSVSVTLEDCTAGDTILVDYVALPEFELNSNSVLCDGDTLVLNVAVPGGTYLWHDGSTDPVYEITAPGAYSVVVEANDCTDSDTLDVVFTPLPVFTLGEDTTLCDGEVLSLAPGIAGGDVAWQDNSNGPVFDVTAPGEYFAEVTRDGCPFADSITVAFKPLPTVDLGSDTSLCEGTTIEFEFNEPGVTYVWNDGVVATSREIATGGLWVVVAELDQCFATSDVFVDFQPPPAIDLPGELVLCDGETTQLVLQEPGVEYEWNGMTRSNSFTVDVEGTVAVEAYKLNCSRRDSVQVVYNRVPYFSLGDDRHGCPGEIITIIPDTNTTYTWHNGVSSEFFEVDAPGLVSAERTLNGCSWRDSIRVTYSDPLPVELGEDTTICEETEWVLQAFHPDAADYFWSDGSTQPELDVVVPGTYRVEVSDGKCVFDDEVTVNFRECHYFSRYVPNAFSPNGDGSNDELQVYLEPGIIVESFRWRIFNRWGSLIFESTDPLATWDGTFNGEIMPMAVYVYSLEIAYVDDNGPGDFREGGDVMLMTR